MVVSARSLGARTPKCRPIQGDRKSTRLNSSHGYISYAVFCLKKKNSNFIVTYMLRNAGDVDVFGLKSSAMMVVIVSMAAFAPDALCKPLDRSRVHPS